MKLYMLLISILYILAGLLAYTLLRELSVVSSALIAVLAAAIAFISHIVMESLVATDDYEPKITFKDHLSDFKYCGSFGALVFIPSVIAGAGLSLLMCNF